MGRYLRVAGFLCVLVACGGSSPEQPDGGVPVPDAPRSFCGNGVIEAGEACDDGNLVADAVCDTACQFTCGNGLLDDGVGEACDTAITTGAGMCPAACDDGDACTTDVLSGSDCSAACITAPVTTAQDGDGCCPAGANANTDDDCTAMCGNGILEGAEGCDPGITAGAGACPTSCDDLQACTTDTLVGAGSCAAACTNVAITTAVNGDACCPAGATSVTDTDCSVSCGNGVKETGEVCDTTATGPDACPTSCDDGMACTTNVLSNPGTCTAACNFPAITAPANGDGCCPTGANATTDTDCQPVCPNGVVEGTEACDDGNQNTADACSNTCTPNVVATAFRFGTLALRDPHAFASVFGCNDITNSFFGNAVNQQLATNLTTDGDGDGDLDLSPLVVFRPLDQGATATSPMELHFGTCTAPVAGTSCTPGASTPVMLTATNQATGTCLGVLAGTAHTGAPTYSPAITTTSGPCFASDEATVQIDLAGIPLRLYNGRVAATYVGTPAGTMVNGLLRGFLSEADAASTILPSTLAVIGGQPLSSLFPGGTGNCASFSDKDSNNGVAGWWLYLNFTTSKVTWVD